jgi:outer membrane cobalamin receptor
MRALPVAFAIAVAFPCTGWAYTGTAPGDILSLSFEDLANVDVSASSLLPSTIFSAASSISAISPREWENSGARRPFEALGSTPGVFVMPHTNGNQVLAIRGYGRLTSFTGVAVTLDGVPLTDLYRSSPQYNFPGMNLGVMSQLQLIQGPGSALYGSDAFHGLLAMRTHEGDESGQQGSVAVGPKGYYEGAALVSRVQDGGGRWSLAVAANGQGDQERSATRPNPAGGAPIVVARENRFLAQSAVLKGSTAAVAGWRLNAGIYLHRYGADNFQGLGSRLAGAQDLGGLVTSFAMLQAGAKKNFGDSGALELKAYGWWVDNDLAGRVQTASGPLHRDLYSRQDRYGLQAIYRDTAPAWNTDWALALATEQLHVREVHVAFHSITGAFVSDTPNAASGAHRRVHSATLELNTKLGGKWLAVYGGRLDSYSDFGQQTSPRVGLIYQADSSSALKLLYGQAFRAPSAAEQIGTAGTVLGNPTLKPEVINSFELVAIGQRNKFVWQASMFKTDWRDGIAIAFRQDLKINQFQNVDRNKAHGATAGVGWRDGDWQFDASGAWVSSEKSSTRTPYNIYPRRSATASLAYGALTGSGRFSVAQRWMDGFDDIPSGDVFAPTSLPSYSRTDLSYSLALSPMMTVTAVVRNLFDRDSHLPSPLGSVGGIPDERRNASVRASWKF